MHRKHERKATASMRARRMSCGLAARRLGRCDHGEILSHAGAQIYHARFPLLLHKRARRGKTSLVAAEETHHAPSAPAQETGMRVDTAGAGDNHLQRLSVYPAFSVGALLHYGTPRRQPNGFGVAPRLQALKGPTTVHVVGCVDSGRASWRSCRSRVLCGPASARCTRRPPARAIGEGRGVPKDPASQMTPKTS